MQSLFEPPSSTFRAINATVQHHIVPRVVSHLQYIDAESRVTDSQRRRFALSEIRPAKLGTPKIHLIGVFRALHTRLINTRRVPL